MKIQGRFSRFIVPDLKCLKEREEKGQEETEMEWAQVIQLWG